MKIGDYVRTKDGYIYKIEDGEEFYEDYVDVGIGTIPDVDGIWVDKAHFQYVDKREIIKSSPNIIDLIEVGDYVNGMKITDIKIDLLGNVEYVFGYSKEGFEGETMYYDEDIKSIVTKEQFKEMEYEVK